MMGAFRGVATMLVVGASLHGQARAAQVAVFPDLAAARLRFHTGGVADKRPELSTRLPDMPGDSSGWMVVQWKKAAMLRPETMLSDDLATRDPRLGIAPYAWRAGTGESEVDVFGAPGTYVQQLRARGGWVDEAGGSNLFLQARPALKQATLDKAIRYSVSLKLAEARVSSPDPMAMTDGTVLAQVFTGFSLGYRDPGGGPAWSVALQIEHADSRGRPVDDQSCSLQDGRWSIVSSRPLPGQPWLAFATDAGPPRRLSYSLNRALCDMLERPLACRGADGRQITLTVPDGAHDLRNWTVRGMFIGLETQAADRRASSVSPAPRGEVDVALQVGELAVLRDDADAATCHR